ncbi:hypothetical protein B0I37DRAFT_366790 [Chaetomium sp. MPI-CAGE-AT-0009]|nr:hypothetical protein B0I37DRAFT_366790 [Chaetomium sp. MPI-CAGE-AT-0009]
MHTPPTIPPTLTLKSLTLSLTIALTLLTHGATARPLPLNINLGAYSPALVVGDGAISFEGAEGAEGGAEGAGEAGGNGVSEVVSALQGAAVSGAGSLAAAGGGGAAAAAAAPGDSGGDNDAVAAPPVVQAAAVGVDVVDVGGDGRPRPILNDPTAALPTPGSARVLGPRLDSLE